MTALVLDTLRARRAGIVVVLLGLFGLSVMYLAIFPTLEEQLQAFAGEIPEAVTAFVGDADFATPAGYVRSQVYSLTAPLLTAGVAIAVAGGLAKQERNVTLTPTYLAPVSRTQLALAHLGAGWGIALAAGLGVFVGVLVGAPLAGAEIRVVDVLAATAPFVGFAWAASAVAWAVGAATGSPGAGTGAGWGFVAVSFLTNSVGELIDDVAFLSDVSPWGWYGAGKAVTDGFDPVSLLLFAVAFALVPVGISAFARRDLQL